MSNIFKDTEFSQMLIEHALEVLDSLATTQTPFTILCNVSEAEFTPPLDKEITDTFRPLTLFALDGYTLTTADIDWDIDTLVFEAGFGEKNIGTLVLVPASAILQIAVGESVIFINPTATYVPKKKRSKKTADASEEKSLKSFLNNPENSRFFKE